MTRGYQVKEACRADEMVVAASLFRKRNKSNPALEKQ